MRPAIDAPVNAGLLTIICIGRLGCLLLLIEHFVGPSSIHGLGVFAAQFVPKGARVWVYHPAIDRIIPASDLAGLPGHVIERIETHSEYLPKQDAFRMSADGDYYLNHSDDPNLENRGDNIFARRDIQAGEELHFDYRQTLVLSFDPDTKLPHRQASTNFAQ